MSGTAQAERIFGDPPAAVVENGSFVLGRFAKAPGRINMLDVARPFHYPIPRFLKDYRLKEWVAVQFGDARRVMMAAILNAKSVSICLFWGYDRRNGTAFGFQRLLPGGCARFPSVFCGSTVKYRGLGVTVALSIGKENATLDVERRSRRESKRILGHFEFAMNARQSAQQSVCLPLGLNRALYSTKVLMPMRGALDLGTERALFEGNDSMGILDDHKGFYPFNMRYDWVTGFGLDAKERRVGFNLTDNQVRDPERYNENCVWINSRLFALPPVKFSRPQGAAGVWHVQDTEGRVDLSFTPELPHSVKANFLLLGFDYDGPFGSFKGYVKTPDGERIEADRLYGMGEKQLLTI